MWNRELEKETAGLTICLYQWRTPRAHIQFLTNTAKSIIFLPLKPHSPQATSLPVQNAPPAQHSYTNKPSSRSPIQSTIISTSNPDSAKCNNAYLLVYLRAPPPKPVHPARIHEPEKHDHECERQPRVERGGEGHGVFAPPGGGATADEAVEEEAD